MRIFTAFLTIVMSFVCIASQTTQSQFDAAVEAYESGEYERTISLLEAYEKSRGTSPRLESLRALAYRDLEKPKEAHQAVLVYLRLTANRDMSASEAHQDMLKLRDEMLEAIEKKYKEDKEKLDKERDEAATTIVDELEESYRSPQIKRSYSSALPASLKTEADDANGEYIGPPPTESKTAPGMDSLTELEMWRKINQSTVAMDYFLFIESFPNGQFTEIARRKMMDIGDPAWNAVRDTFDPFKFRDFIKNNPDSPFLAIAKTRMDELAKVAIDWEQVKDSRDPSKLRAFEARHPGHTLAAESKKIRAEIAWRSIENLSSPAVFQNYLSEFPESSYASAARAALNKLDAPLEGGISSAALRPFSPSGDPTGDINRMADNFLASRSFRSTTIIVIPGQPPVSTTMEFVAPDRFRIVNANGPDTLIIGKDYYSDASGRWEKTPANAAASMPDMRSAWDKKGRDQLSDAKYLGEETVNGRATHVYTAFAKGINGAGANDSKFWIAKSDGLPVRMEAVYRAGPLRSLTIDYDYDSKISIEVSGAGDSSPATSPSGEFSRFSNIKADFIRKQSAWSEFQDVEACSVKFSIHTYYEDPTRDTSVLDFRNDLDVEVKEGQNVWSVTVKNIDGKTFTIERTIFTRNPMWGSAKATEYRQYKAATVARFPDQTTASDLAQLIRERKGRCANQ